MTHSPKQTVFGGLWPFTVGVLVSGVGWAWLQDTPPYGSIILIPAALIFYAGRWSMARPSNGGEA